MTRYLFILILLSLLTATAINFCNIKNWFLDLVKDSIVPEWLWALMFIAIVNIGALNQSESIKAGQLKQLVITLPVVCIITLLILLRSRVILWFNTTNIFILLYGLSGIVSGIYSPEPLYSTYKAILVIVAVFIGLIVLTYQSQLLYIRRFIELTYAFYFVMMFSYVVGVIISPEKALIIKEGALIGLLKGWLIEANPNTVGYVGGFICLLSVYRSTLVKQLQSKIMYCVFAFASLIVLVYGQSRTCIVGFIISLMLILMYRKKYISIIFIFIIGSMFVSLNTFKPITENVVTYYKRGQSDKQFETWSGRLTTWKQVWVKYTDAPLLGYGMAAGVKYGAVSESLVGSHLHSSYFEILLNSGLLGFIPWSLGLLFTTITLLKRHVSNFMIDKSILQQELSVLFIFSLIRTIAGTTFVVFDNTFIFYVCVIMFTTYIKQTAKPLRPIII